MEEHRKEWCCSPTSIGLSHFVQGDKDLGFEWLERAYEEGDVHLTSLKVNWELDGVRNDPRYIDLVRRLGLG